MLDEMSKEMLQNVPYVSGIIIRKPQKKYYDKFWRLFTRKFHPASIILKPLFVFLMKSGIGMLYYLCSKEKSSFNLDLQSMVGKGHRRDSLNLIHWKFVCCVILSYASGDYLAVRYSKRDPRRNLSLQSPAGHFRFRLNMQG